MRCGFAERLLYLGFLTTSINPRLHFFFSISAPCVLALFRGSRHFGYRAGHIHQEPNRAASGFAKFILFGPLLFAIAMAVFGADHFVAASFVAKIVPRSLSQPHLRSGYSS